MADQEHRSASAKPLAKLVLLAAAIALSPFLVANFRPEKLGISIRSLGYTNAVFDSNGLQTHPVEVCTVSNGARAIVLQVSNASPFTVVRGRSPVVTFESPDGSRVLEAIPAGWNVLQAHECERFELEPPANGTRWKLSLTCERLGSNSYGIGRPDVRARIAWMAIWLRDHGLPVAQPIQEPAAQFCSDWIAP